MIIEMRTYKTKPGMRAEFLESRGPLKDKFYEGELWKRELEHKLLPMLEKYDVVLVEAKDGLGSWQ